MSLQSSSSSSSSAIVSVGHVMDLPEELLVSVLSHLALADLCRTAAACRTLRRVATDDRLLWRARCLDRFGPEALEARAEGSSWEQHWATLLDHHRRGCELFNQNLGIDYLVEHRVLRAEPQAIADFLSKTPGLYKKSIGWTLGRRAKDCSKEEETILDDVDAPELEMDFYSSVAQLYMSGIDFHDLTVDEALRQLLLRVKLPGSSQFIRRILKDFAMAYYKQNKVEAERLFKNAEGPYIAAYSILMLNTDLHNPRVSRKMKKNEFQEHFSAMLPGLPREYIEGVYDRIRAVELRVADEDSVSGSSPASASISAATTARTGSDDADTQGKGLKGFFSRFF